MGAVLSDRIDSELCTNQCSSPYFLTMNNQVQLPHAPPNTVPPAVTYSDGPSNCEPQHILPPLSCSCQVCCHGNRATNLYSGTELGELLPIRHAFCSRDPRLREGFRQVNEVAILGFVAQGSQGYCSRHPFPSQVCTLAS